jgi:uncharacterized protein (TIGR02147 family)
MSVFQFDSYREFLALKVRENKLIRGYKAKLAEAANCHRSAIPQVTSGAVNLTLDQASGLCQFWGLSDSETDFFIELVNLERAGTPAFRSIVKRRLKKLKAEKGELKERFPTAQALSQDWQSLYYSNWHWVAIHVLISIPGFRQPGRIAERLHLPLTLVQQSLEKMAQMGIVTLKGSEWTVKEHDLFLPRDSHMTITNHFNWRQRAILNIQSFDKESIHYTNVHALKKSDIERFKDVVLECIDRTKAIVQPSPEEEMICFSCDVFKV